MLKYGLCAWVLFFYALLGQADYRAEQYFLCGSDEDGCPPNYYQACLCMPYDGPLAAQPYCLNFDELSCKPLSLSPHCPSTAIFKDQGTCLAVAFQSEPEPPCPLKSKTFCLKHHIAICDRDGGESTCRSQ